MLSAKKVSENFSVRFSYTQDIKGCFNHDCSIISIDKKCFSHWRKESEALWWQGTASTNLC